MRNSVNKATIWVMMVGVMTSDALITASGEGHWGGFATRAAERIARKKGLVAG